MTVYFCRAAYGPIKIGCTNGAAAERVTAFGRLSKAHAKLLASLDGYRTREYVIHSLLDRHRIGTTETFEPSDTVWRFILDVAEGEADWLPPELAAPNYWDNPECQPERLRREAVELFGSVEALRKRVGMTPSSFAQGFRWAAVTIRSALALERLRKKGRIPAYLLDSMDYCLPQRKAA